MAERARPQLTPTQWRVLERLAGGERDAAIARDLGLAFRTVKAQVGAIYQALALEDVGTQRVAAARWYTRQQYQQQARDDG